MSGSGGPRMSFASPAPSKSVSKDYSTVLKSRKPTEASPVTKPTVGKLTFNSPEKKAVILKSGVEEKAPEGPCEEKRAEFKVETPKIN